MFNGFYLIVSYISFLLPPNKSNCYTNWYNKQYPFIISQFLYIRSLGVGYLGLLLWVSPSLIKVIQWAVISSEAPVFFQAHPGCWQNAVPCGCGIDVSILLPTVG